jgi:hypothetical protein
MSKPLNVEQLARAYAERGFVVVEDYLANDVVDACRAECEDVMRCALSALLDAHGACDDAMAWTDVRSTLS